MEIKRIPYIILLILIEAAYSVRTAHRSRMESAHGSRIDLVPGVEGPRFPEVRVFFSYGSVIKFVLQSSCFGPKWPGVQISGKFNFFFSYNSVIKFVLKSSFFPPS